MTAQENERQYQQIDQRLSAHAFLRDRSEHRSLWLSVLLLAASILLNAFVFAGDDVTTYLFGTKPIAWKLWLGFPSVLIMVLSIVELRVDWGGQARLHADAVSRLGRLKADFRAVHALGDKEKALSYPRLSDEYARVMEQLPRIPEKLFLTLKARHKFKCLVSKALEDNPAAWPWLLSIRLRLAALKGRKR